MKKLCLLLTMLFAFHYTLAQTATDKLQAVYIYNFAKYIKWSTDPSTFVIGIFGNPEMSAFLQRSLAEKKMGGKAIVVKSFTKLEEIDQCQIVYIPKAKSRQMAAINNYVAGKGILIVTEDDLSKKGAGISFFQEDNNLKFKLNYHVLTKSGLTPSSGLLALAIVIYEK